MELEECTARDHFKCGLQQMWVEAEKGNVEIEVSCGAGLGSSWMRVTVKEPGKADRLFRFNVRQVVEEALRLCEEEPKS